MQIVMLKNAIEPSESRAPDILKKNRIYDLEDVKAKVLLAKGVAVKLEDVKEGEEEKKEQKSEPTKDTKKAPKKEQK